MSPAAAGRFFTTEPHGKPLILFVKQKQNRKEERCGFVCGFSDNPWKVPEDTLNRGRLRVRSRKKTWLFLFFFFPSPVIIIYEYKIVQANKETIKNSIPTTQPKKEDMETSGTQRENVLPGSSEPPS